MIQRRAVVGAVCAVSVSVLTACGFQAPAVTDHEHASIQGASFSVGSIRIRAGSITTLESLDGTATNVVVTFVNDGPTGDTLTGATSPLGAVTISGGASTGGQLALPYRGAPVQLIDPALDVSGATMTIAAAKPPVAGSFVPVTFTFAKAGASSTELLPVVPYGETTSPSVTLPEGVATPPAPEGEKASD